jgi:hypothetical protein
MLRALDPLVRLWRDKIWGPRLRTYEGSRQELGGLPWRKFTSTDRWFLSSPVVPREALTTSPGATTLDTGALKIVSRSGLKRPATWLIGAAALGALVLALVAPKGAHAPAATAAVAAAPQPAPAPAQRPVVAAVQPIVVTATAPAVAPAPVTQARKADRTPARGVSKPKVSPSVQALFSGKSSKGGARSSHGKKGRRR